MSNRGKSIGALTKYMLCAKAAGRCQFKGCNKYLFQDDITLHKFNKSNLAHIIAASPDGPRGDEELSHMLSDDVDNIMLLCPEHHKLIDSEEEYYTVERLREMKREHEESIQKLCGQATLSDTTIVRLTSPIKALQQSTIDYRQTLEAIQWKCIPSDEKGVVINIESGHDYKSEEYWADVKVLVEQKYNTQIASRIAADPQIVFSVFPLAPIPLIIYLGYLMGDKVVASVFQKNRFPDTWNWISDVKTNAFEDKYYVNPEARDDGVALIVSLSAEINKTEVINSCGAKHIFTIEAGRKGVDSICSEVDLAEFWRLYQSVLDNITHDLQDIDVIYVFPAVPVSAAFEMGRRYMPKAHPRLVIYDKHEDFIKAIEIGG